MTPCARFLIVFSLIGIFLIPGKAFAAVGLQPGYEVDYDYVEKEEKSQEPEEELSTGALLELEKKQQLWELRKQRTRGFWADMMNNRATAKAFKQKHSERKEKRVLKRIACRKEVRRANRDSVNGATLRCFRAVLTLDLEMLRKERQFLATIAGVSDEYRSAADFHIDNLMDAISTIIQAIDAGVYGDKEGVADGKKNLGEAYRSLKRLSMTRVRVDRSVTWLNHLMVRLQTVIQMTDLSEEIAAKLDNSIACLESKETALQSLFEVEDNKALIESFRQVQSEVNICTDMALEAHRLNTETEQDMSE